MIKTRRGAEVMHARQRRSLPLTVSAKLTVAALVGLALSYLYLVVMLIGGFVPMAITVPVALLLAGVVATGWRPAPAIATFVCVLGLLPEVPNVPGHLQEIATDPPSFVVNVLLILPFFAVAIVAGVAATVQNYRRIVSRGILERRTPMSSTILFRLSGLSLLLGTLLAIIDLFIHPESGGLAYYADPATALSHLVGFVSVLLTLLGLPGLYAYQAKQAGILGLVSTVLVFFSVAMLDGTHTVIDSAITPALATIPEAAPLLASGGPLEEAMQSGVQGTLVSVWGPVFLLSLILLGVTTIRAGVLPRWAGALPIVAALTVPLGFVVPSLEGVAFAMPYVALGCLGLILTMSEGGTSTTTHDTVKPAPRVQ